MKIRIMGTADELSAAAEYYASLRDLPYVKDVTISRPYLNRGSNAISRLYVEISFCKELNNYDLLSSRKSISDRESN